jgi:hypothetical protein
VTPLWVASSHSKLCKQKVSLSRNLCFESKFLLFACRYVQGKVLPTCVEAGHYAASQIIRVPYFLSVSSTPELLLHARWLCRSLVAWSLPLLLLPASVPNKLLSHFCSIYAEYKIVLVQDGIWSISYYFGCRYILLKFLHIMLIP